MPIQEIGQWNMSGGFHVIFQYVNYVTNGVFINMLIVSIWCIFCFGSYFFQKRTTGRGDFPTSLAVAGFVTAISTILLGLIPQLVTAVTYAIVTAVALVSILIFFFNKNNS